MHDMLGHVIGAASIGQVYYMNAYDAQVPIHISV